MKKNDFRKLLIGLALLVMTLTGCGLLAAEKSENADISRQQETEENASPDVPTEVISLDALNPEQVGNEDAASTLTANRNEAGATVGAGNEDAASALAANGNEAGATVETGNEDAASTLTANGNEAGTTVGAGNESAVSTLTANGNENETNASGIESKERSVGFLSESTEVNDQEASAWENAEIYYSSYGYRITIPFEWKETVSIVETESGTDFICTPAEEENYTGLLFSLQRMSEDEYNKKSLESQVITKAAEVGGEVIAAVYPQEETYDEENSYAKESYETAAGYIEGVLGSCRSE